MDLSCNSGKLPEKNISPGAFIPGDQKISLRWRTRQQNRNRCPLRKITSLQWITYSEVLIYWLKGMVGTKFWHFRTRLALWDCVYSCIQERLLHSDETVSHNSAVVVEPRRIPTKRDQPLGFDPFARHSRITDRVYHSTVTIHSISLQAGESSPVPFAKGDRVKTSSAPPVDAAESRIHPTKKSWNRLSTPPPLGVPKLKHPTSDVYFKYFGIVFRMMLSSQGLS
jgi:hypothetical protein